MRKISIVCLSLLMLNLNACAKKPKGTDSYSNNEYDTGEMMEFHGSNTVSDGESERGIAKNTYYFGYDTYDLTEQDTIELMNYAKKLVANPNSHIRIEGHTDERGSREYNVALGERRAKAITNILLMKGVAPKQISIVSYGKEKPASFGHDESSWSLNRRGVLANEGV